MKHVSYPVRLTLTALAVLGLAQAAIAQQAPQDMVPLKVTFTGSSTAATSIPVSPPIVPVTLSFTGELAPLGQVTYVSHEIHRFGVTGAPQAITDGVGAFTAANGDAIFVTHSGLILPTATAGIFTVEEAWTAYGGKGKFLGATGSGVLKATIDARELATKGIAGWTLSYDGMVSAPKP